MFEIHLNKISFPMTATSEFLLVATIDYLGILISHTYLFNMFFIFPKRRLPIPNSYINPSISCLSLSNNFSRPRRFCKIIMPNIATVSVLLWSPVGRHPLLSCGAICGGDLEWQPQRFTDIIVSGMEMCRVRKVLVSKLDLVPPRTAGRREVGLSSISFIRLVSNDFIGHGIATGVIGDWRYTLAASKYFFRTDVL